MEPSTTKAEGVDRSGLASDVRAVSWRKEPLSSDKSHTHGQSPRIKYLQCARGFTDISDFYNNLKHNSSVSLIKKHRFREVTVSMEWWYWGLNTVLPGTKSTLCPFAAGGDGINPDPVHPYPGPVSQSYSKLKHRGSNMFLFNISVPWKCLVEKT